MDVMHLQAEFSTDYEVEEWNKSSADRSYIATTTIKPTVTSSYGWSWQGAELSGAIPYRWGFAEGEQAWVQAQLANPTEAEADKVALDVSASGITADPLAGARGFLPNGVAIEGFRTRLMRRPRAKAHSAGQTEQRWQGGRASRIGHHRRGGAVRVQQPADRRRCRRAGALFRRRSADEMD